MRTVDSSADTGAAVGGGSDTGVGAATLGGPSWAAEAATAGARARSGISAGGAALEWVVAPTADRTVVVLTATAAVTALEARRTGSGRRRCVTDTGSRGAELGSGSVSGAAAKTTSLPGPGGSAEIRASVAMTIACSVKETRTLRRQGRRRKRRRPRRREVWLRKRRRALPPEAGGGVGLFIGSPRVREGWDQSLASSATIGWTGANAAAGRSPRASGDAVTDAVFSAPMLASTGAVATAVGADVGTAVD